MYIKTVKLFKEKYSHLIFNKEIQQIAIF